MIFEEIRLFGHAYDLLLDLVHLLEELLVGAVRHVLLGYLLHIG